MECSLDSTGTPGDCSPEFVSRDDPTEPTFDDSPPEPSTQGCPPGLTIQGDPIGPIAPVVPQSLHLNKAAAAARGEEVGGAAEAVGGVGWTTNKLEYIRSNVMAPLWMHPFAWPFHVPVDAVQLKLPVGTPLLRCVVSRDLKNERCIYSVIPAFTQFLMHSLIKHRIHSVTPALP